MFKHVMSCYVDIFDLIELAIFGLIQIWECALNWLQGNQSTNTILTFVTPVFKRATSSSSSYYYYYYYVIPMCK